MRPIRMDCRVKPGSDDVSKRPCDALASEFCPPPRTKIDSLPPTKEGAERREAHANHVRAAQTSVRSLRHPSATRLRASSGEARPPVGAHACGTRHRLSPRWLSPRTGFPEDRLCECFARSALLPSVKHAPCGPVFLPVDRGPRAARERSAYLRARAPAPLLRPSKVPSRKAPSPSRVKLMYHNR
jgi:hypothetical protein